MMNVHYSSKSVEWETPQDLYDRLDAEYHFTTDLAASDKNAKCAHYYTAFDSGLCHAWQGNCWLNPPYGRNITGKWIEKAALTALAGHGTVVCLLPARTDTAWWHDWVIPYGEITFLRGRLNFNGGKGRAPFPSVIVVFHQR
jgi:phage N-6-adenine-methyltransferase